MSPPIACVGRGLFVSLAVALIAAPAAPRADPSGVTWEQTIAVAAGGGFRGPWRMNESEYDYVDDPTVAINEQGVVGVGWADQSAKDIFFQILEPGGTKRFEKPVNPRFRPSSSSWSELCQPR